MQGLPMSPRESPLLDATASEEDEEEDEEEAIPAPPPPAPDLATKLRLIQLAGVSPPVEQIPQVIPTW